MRKCRRLAFAAMMFGAMVNQTAKADPGPIVTYLMGQPASVFDLGMYRLSEFLLRLNDNIEERYQPRTSHMVAGYSFNENRIQLVHIIAIPREPDKEGLCKDMIDFLRSSAGFQNGKLVTFLENSIYSSLFSYSGYSNNNEPKNYRNKLDEIMQIRVVVDGFICEAPLIGTGYSVVK